MRASTNQVRFSAPFFFNPSYDAVVKPLLSKGIGEGGGGGEEGEIANYRAFTWGHFRKERFLGDYSDRGREIQIEDYAIRRA